MDQFESLSFRRKSLRKLKKLPALDFSDQKSEKSQNSANFTCTTHGQNSQDFAISEPSEYGEIDNKRKAGRYRMNDEDKAHPKTFRLTNLEMELLSYAPGKNDTEKLRYILKNYYRFQLKMMRCSHRVKKAIQIAYSDLRALTSPEIHQHDQSKKKKLISNFQQSYDELVATINFYELEKIDFDEMLENDQQVMLSAVLMGKESLL